MKIQSGFIINRYIILCETETILSYTCVDIKRFYLILGISLFKIVEKPMDLNFKKLGYLNNYYINFEVVIYIIVAREFS